MKRLRVIDVAMWVAVCCFIVFAGCDKPLPQGAFKADITVENPPAALKANSLSRIDVRVKNIGTSEWPVNQRNYNINLGYHWLNKNESVAVWDGERTPLQSSLGPDREVVLKAAVKAPGKPADYILEFDMVQEEVSWFNAKGSKTKRVDVRVD